MMYRRKVSLDPISLSVSVSLCLSRAFLLFDASRCSYFLHSPRVCALALSLPPSLCDIFSFDLPLFCMIASSPSLLLCMCCSVGSHHVHVIRLGSNWLHRILHVRFSHAMLFCRTGGDVGVGHSPGTRFASLGISPRERPLPSVCLSFFGLVWCRRYSPAKYAVHGLATVLRNELLPYNILVYNCYPPTMDTPGLSHGCTLTRNTDCG